MPANVLTALKGAHRQHWYNQTRAYGRHPYSTNRASPSITSRCVAGIAPTTTVTLAGAGMKLIMEVAMEELEAQGAASKIASRLQE